ncbi:CgeB family protein [Siccirubricoccus phaeus]|uniref:CgeB family protein n=1 Tax=Siccirubricoccus phaeus TaxID=2595053 RepID=UPI0011F2439E|nr:glycosyltransferase [Siccirubricoccus phaeus]
MKLVYFTHSLTSCWNHGNAHFLRGVLSALQARGHDVCAWEPADAWSAENLRRDHGAAALEIWRNAYPGLRSQRYRGEAEMLPALEGADVIIAHEWNEPWLIAALGRARRQGGRFLLLFHDTHHRAVSDPESMRRDDLESYDGILAFGEALARVYRRWGWGRRVVVWHEAADTGLFHPPVREPERDGLIWIGNWGDDERSVELEEFLLRPAREVGLPLDIHGVRYPQHALATLARYGARYHGWLPNVGAPEAFARHLATVHVPRRFYVDLLPGIPTIRVFEALACGIPLVTAPWRDEEGLFRPGQDYLVAHDGAEMARHLGALRDDPALRAALVANGLATIRARHSCAHRAEELLHIIGAMTGVHA